MGKPRGMISRLRGQVARHPRLVAAAVIGVAAVTALCVTLVLTLGGGGPAPARLAVAPSPMRMHAPPPPPPRPKGPLLDPLTGEPVRALGPVLAVKIDNIVYARPQTGLQSADLVYVIPVEGGLTRFMAVYSARIPPVVGPVRSARQSDLDLLRQFGRPAFAWSGATPHLLPFIERSPIIDLYAAFAAGYYRDPYRIAPYNLYGSTKQLMREARGASKVRDIGFRFGALPAGGRAAATYSVRYPATSYTFRWSARARRWLAWIDGAPARATEGGQLGGRTVIIQYTQVALSRFEEYGGLPPYAKSVGSGRAVVLRDGKEFSVRWSRPSLEGGTVYTLPDGKRMLFTPGQVWVVLAPQDRQSYRNAAAV
jgi:hypothetical protein